MKQIARRFSNSILNGGKTRRQSLFRALTQLLPAVFIHAQQIHRGPANGRQADDFTVAIFEMVFPIIEPRMEQARHFPVSRIEAGKVHPLVQVAVMTRDRQIIGKVLAAVTPGNDVLDVKRKRLLVLTDLAILAAVFRPSPDQLTQAIVHQAAFAFAMALRALA